MPELKGTASHLERDVVPLHSPIDPSPGIGKYSRALSASTHFEAGCGAWLAPERFHVIDCDLGKSASQAAGRTDSNNW